MPTNRLLHNTTGKKTGDQIIGRLPRHVDPHESYIVVPARPGMGKSEQVLADLHPAAAREISRQIAGADHLVLDPLSNMMETPVAEPMQAPMNRAARRRAARGRRES